MFRMLEAQAPPKQSAEDTIATLSGRLESATLLEDRRAAILGLRSFAKLYPASVASGALRNLISSLGSDAEDVDTTKSVLETLLMLFSPDESSPEASDDIALWLADEFTQRQENITTLLDLLDRQDFFSRLYSLQLISAISTARPERTQECVYTAPLGVSRLVAVLDDKREALRAEGLILLVALTPSSPELQKLVAFENAFDRLFAIIHAEGSLTHGGVIVQDCLSLLANLLRLNASNQSFFRETGGITNVAAILEQVLRDEASPDGVSEWAVPQRDKNLWGFMSVIRLLLSGGSVGTQANQASLWQHGVVFQMLDIAFHPTLDAALRSEALTTCADLIRGNKSLQEKFAQREVVFHIDVPKTPSTPSAPKTNGNSQQKTSFPVNVVQGLLDLSLAVSAPQPFDVRLSACECLKSYFQGHAPIRLHFLARARDGYLSEEDEPDNILSILLDAFDGRRTIDPYQQWIAAVLLFHLVYEDYEAKNLARDIKEGDADKGEEVVTCIQVLAGNLIAKAQKDDDERVTAGYLMVLGGWLYEDPDAVNDFLQEGSSVQSLVQIVAQPGQARAVEAGLCAFLLGIIYEFSTKDSPVPRATLHEILTGRLGRDVFNDKLARLREHPLIRDFEVLGRSGGGAADGAGGGGLPEVYFDKTFVDFLKDNFSRVQRAIDRDPTLEVSVVANGVQKGISRELVDGLKSQLEEQRQTLERAQAEALALESKLGQEQAERRRATESAALDLGKLKAVNEALQRSHDEETRRVAEAHDREIAEATRSVERVVGSMREEARKIKEDNEAVAARVRARHEAELEDLSAERGRLERELEKAARDHAQDLSTANEEYEASKKVLEGRLARAEERAKEAEERAGEKDKEVAEKEEARKGVQTELDDLLMVLADVEEKRTRDKKRLKDLGQEVSEGEDEDDEGEAEDDE